MKAAGAAKIPVVIFDSALQGDAYVSFVATDNAGAGARAADHLVKLLGNRGKVLVLRYQEGSASTAAREEGFLGALRGHDGGDPHTPGPAGASSITVVSDNQYGGATTESAFSASENLLAAQKAAEGGVDGIFCPNESTAAGMLLALAEGGPRRQDQAGRLRRLGEAGEGTCKKASSTRWWCRAPS